MCRFLTPAERKGTARATSPREEAPAPPPSATSGVERTHSYLTNELEKSQEALHQRDQTLSQLAEVHARAMGGQERVVQDRSAKHRQQTVQFEQDQALLGNVRTLLRDVEASLQTKIDAHALAEAVYQSWQETAQSALTSMKEQHTREMDEARAKFKTLENLVILQKELVADAAKRTQKG